MYTPNYYFNPYGYLCRRECALPHFPTYYCIRQMFQPISTKQFVQSTEKYRILLNEANKIINKIAATPKFSYNLMDAAQKSNKPKVDQLIKSTGITVKTINQFTPDGLIIELTNAQDEDDCCSLRLAFKW
ncbi:hypothetical protein [Lederbergia citri]|uniref:Uncharacterized protein n=1 Tax=Lederbergia citri TaxID=2833580 RepID=A0A942TI22_9BACI|nr:hypothetical protein [Lederbergia citri]MBS4197383.1 hypothetical protein [Lederbergia citri]